MTKVSHSDNGKIGSLTNIPEMKFKKACGKGVTDRLGFRVRPTASYLPRLISVFLSKVVFGGRGGRLMAPHHRQMGRDRDNADKKFRRGGTGDRNRDGGWIPVISKHRRQMVDSNNSTITLFVDNLPEDVSQRWVSHLFNKFGVVKDIFIPGKRSKVAGKAFAFVRYDCAVSAEMAISKTNGVWIEDRKLFVKTASFDQKRKEFLKHNPNKNASGNIANKKRASHIQGINLSVELTSGARRKRRRRHINNLFKVQEELDQNSENSVDVTDSSSSLSSEETIISNSVLGEEIRGDETKLENVDLRMVQRLWGNTNVEFAASNSIGASGGLLILWDFESR
ncbi:hypothetical protein C3L33_15707, partial [Rhododendron williamsianum]